MSRCCCFCACAGDGSLNPLREQRTPSTAALPLERNQPPPVAPTQAPLPTAVRVPTIDPDHIVLRPADLLHAFTLADQGAISAVEVSRPREELQPTLTWNPRHPAGSGRYVLLVRAKTSGQRSVVSLSTSVVRFETSVLAAAGYARAERSRPVAREHALTADHHALGDEVRAWQYGLGGAVVDEILFRSRNYVLVVTVVATTGANGTMPALPYATLLRTRLSH